MKNLLDKKILYIICGGISAYKSLETIRLFKKNGAEIKTILTNELKQNNSQQKNDVRLVAVSKGQGQEKILEALKSGHNIFGENYLQEAID